MYINDTMKTNLDPYKTPIEYWFEQKKEKLIVNTLITLFPLLSLFLVATIGIVHVRHQKARIYLYIFLGIVLFYGASLGLQKLLSFYTIPVVLFTWLGVTYYLYKKTILARF